MEQVEELSHRFEQVEEDVKEMKDALLGTKFNKNEGMVATVSNHEARLSSIEKRMDRAMYWLMGASAGSGIAVYKIFESLINK